MSGKIIRFLLFLAVCLMIQGCAAEQKDESWSFEADAVTEALQEDTAGTGAKTGGYNGVDHEPAVDPGTECESDRSEVPGADSGNGERIGDTAEGQEEKCPEGYVYLCGAVKHPGVYEIHEGMRVFEVLELAGGMTEEADPAWINQAQPVSDGQMLQIYTKEETDQMRSSGMTAGDSPADSDMKQAAETSDEKININTAGREELMTLPGIGEAKADAILLYRQEHGAFGSIEEICQISGIKEAVFSKIKDRITV